MYRTLLVMNDPFTGAIAALETAREVWRDAGSFAGMALAALVTVGNEVGAARRHVETILSRAAAEVARQSRVELGRDARRKQGFRSPNAMIAAATAPRSVWPSSSATVDAPSAGSTRATPRAITSDGGIGMQVRPI